MPFRRKRRQLAGKAYEKHSDTLVSVIGPATTLTSVLLVRDSEVGPRDETGATDTIQLGRGNNEECNVGDTCKYVNLTIQAGPTVFTDQSIGWIEWAFCIMKAVELDPVNTLKGTNTLGDICTKYLRNNCIYTGAVPVGRGQTMTQHIQLKIPSSRQMLRQGDEWKLFYWARTTNATESSTNSFKVFSSFNYKNYH